VSERLEQRQQQRIEGLLTCVRELEETVLYLAQSLKQHGLLSETEASVAVRMYEQGRDIRRETNN
jgi:hypothetical protein